MLNERELLFTSIFASYLISALIYLISFWKPIWQFSRLKIGLLSGGCFLHFLVFVYISFSEQKLPIHTIQDITSVLAFMIVFCYLIIHFIFMKSQLTESGGFIALAASLLQLTAALLPQHEILESSLKPIIEVHIGMVILGYTTAFISGIHSLLYLGLFYCIQKNYFGAFFDKMPSLDTIEKIGLISAKISFFILSFAFLLGVVEVSQSGSFILFSDPKLIGFVGLWFANGISLVLKSKLKLQGKKIAMVFSGCFVVAFILILIINFLNDRFHQGG